MDKQPTQPAVVEEENYFVPPVNICEKDDEIVVEAEMPGVDKSRLQVTVNGDELEIIGRRADEKNGGNLVYQEIPTCGYRRAFNLGDHINRSRIQAAFNNGILTLKLAKAEDTKPRKIDVEFN